MCLLAISVTTLLKTHQHDGLNMSNKHAKVGRQNPKRNKPYTKIYRQQRTSESGRNSLQGRAHQLVIQYQMIIPINTFK